MTKPRKPILDLIEELKSWLPNFDHGPNDYPTLLWRILASIPGGDEAEGMGYEPFNLGWHEVEQLGNVLAAIQDKRDVEDLIAGLLADEEGVEERRRRPRRHLARIGTVIPSTYVPPAEPPPPPPDGGDVGERRRRLDSRLRDRRRPMRKR